ncbi:HalOD1 output domain-containing protein [Halomicroarcula sp. GCM10025709]|uniref:HalOD1 output domain-containing protein n=1 Tax=Haloarcula TaxID=2237 RepID=UPI0024C45FEB|nr:HalOD1 output domain-containing protein [Halomicroarcula sp. YJ-61-S]
MSERIADRTMDEDDPISGADTDWSQVAQRHYEPEESGELTTVIIYTIAEVEGISPTEVMSPPLYECVDTAAVENMFFGTDVTGGSRQGVGMVEFQYADYLVKVRSDGWVQVYEPTETELS